MFENILADLLSVSGVKGVFVTDSDGALIESETIAGLDELSSEMHAALIVDIFNKASEILSKLSNDSVELVLVDGAKERIVASRAGENLLVGVLADHKTNYGLLKIELKKAVEKIAAMV